MLILKRRWDEAEPTTMNKSSLASATLSGFPGRNLPGKTQRVPLVYASFRLNGLETMPAVGIWLSGDAWLLHLENGLISPALPWAQEADGRARSALCMDTWGKWCRQTHVFSNRQHQKGNHGRDH